MKKVLIVDDDKGILGALSMILDDYGYEVEMVESENEVYPTISNFHPDLIILDILLSGSDGRDICKKIKSTADTKNIPIVLSSANVTVGSDISTCMANDFLPKPYDIDTLIQKVEKYVN